MYQLNERKRENLNVGANTISKAMVSDIVLILFVTISFSLNDQHHQIDCFGIGTHLGE